MDISTATSPACIGQPKMEEQRWSTGQLTMSKTAEVKKKIVDGASNSTSKIS